MATWKKVLTRDSAVSITDGLYLGTVENLEDVSVDINLNDGVNTDTLTLTTTTGLKANVVSGNIVIQPDFPALQDGVLNGVINVGTQTGIVVTYDNTDNEVDFVVNNSSLVASSGTNAVVLTLTGPAGDTDAITINEGSNITIDSIGEGAFTINAATLTEEQVEDYVWTMLDGTHIGLSIVYADEDAGGLGELTFTVDDQDFTTVVAGNAINVVLSQPDTDAVFSVSAGANVTLTNAGGADGFQIAVTDADIQGALQTETLVAAQSTNNVIVTLNGSAGESDSITLVAGSGITLTESSGSNIEIASAAPSTINVTDGDDAGTVYPMFASVSNGEATVYTDASTFTYDRSTDTLTVGNLTVTGTTTTVDTTNLVVTDKNILIADGAATPGDASGAGLTVDSGGQFVWETGATLTGWKVADTDAVKHEISTMDFGIAAPAAGNNAAGIGSFHLDSSAGKLYIRTA